MIITALQQIQAPDRASIWNSLRRFQNVSYVAEWIARIHGVPPSHRKNVQKQAEQIRFCLLQAAEYFQAAGAVSLATKPLLLYYGMMSLALTEILFKQDGGSSLDAARGENAHHGLTLCVAGKPSSKQSIADAASALRARSPINIRGNRFGTFELWHKSSRETPIAGTTETHFANGGSNKSSGIVAIADDVRMSPLPESGISLLDCFQSIPGMIQPLGELGVRSQLVRASLGIVTDARKMSNFSLIIHPNHKELIEECIALMLFESRAFEQLSIVELPNAYVVGYQVGPGFPHVHFRLPNCLQSRVTEAFFCTRNNSLNEFGLYYVGLYILGNYARYYPEEWMQDVERCTSLATAADAFLSLAEDRAPMLTLSELSQKWYVG